LRRLTQRSIRFGRLVGLSIVFDRLDAVPFRRNDRLDVAGFEVVADRVGVVPLVREQLLRVRFDQRHERIVPFDVVRLAASQREGERPTFGVDAQMDFGGEAAA